MEVEAWQVALCLMHPLDPTQGQASICNISPPPSFLPQWLWRLQTEGALEVKAWKVALCLMRPHSWNMPLYHAHVPPPPC